MRFVRLVAVAALGLTAACGSTSASNHPSPTFATPIGAPPRYLGAVTSVYTITSESSTLSPPPAGMTPRYRWARVLRQVCHIPGGTPCNDPHVTVEGRLGILDMRSGWSPYIPDNGLVYYVTQTGIRCNTILTSGVYIPPGSPPRKSMPTWCQTNGFYNAETGSVIGGGVGPMPGQQ